MDLNSQNRLSVPLQSSESIQGNIQGNESTQKKSCLPRIEWSWIVGLRLGIIIATCAFMILNTIFAFAMPSTTIDCVLDKTFVLTGWLNTFFFNHVIVKQATMIVTSLFTDCMITYTLFYWAFCGRSLRLLITFCIFYIAHSIIRIFFLVEYPPNMLWDYPNFPSLFVSYVKTSSIFFANCLGLQMICFMEWKKLRKSIQMYIMLSSLIVECLIMHSLRAHYIIDIFSGIFIGHYLFIIVDAFADYIDKTLPFIENESKPNQRVSNSSEGNIPLIHIDSMN